MPDMTPKPDPAPAATPDMDAIARDLRETTGDTKVKELLDERDRLIAERDALRRAVGRVRATWDAWDHSDTRTEDAFFDAVRELLRVAAPTPDAGARPATPDAVAALLRGMTPAQRVAAMGPYCVHCGADDPACRCTDDE